jgi:hypothetical protein
METRKEKIQRKSTFLSRRIFQPLQSRSPLDVMKVLSTNSSRKNISLKKVCLMNKMKTFKLKKSLDLSSTGLPRLPFGKHSSYNNVSSFTRNLEFIDSPQRNQKISLKTKKYFKVKKVSLTRETSPKVKEIRGKSLKCSKIQELTGSGGRLFIEIDAFGINNYNAEKMKYASLLNSISIF